MVIVLIALCLSLCNMLTFESFDVESSFLVDAYLQEIWVIFMYMKAIGSSSRSQQQKKTKFLIAAM